MTDHKFTDQELITLLNQCHDTESIVAFVIDNGNYRSEVVTLQRLIALINHQKREIESLNAVHADVTESLRLAAEANKDMQAEIDRLTTERDNEHKCYLHICDDLKQAINRNITAKAEAIKEFAEAVKIEFYREFDEVIPSVMADKIDTLVKEMMEENK